jgi:hypothetical protein
MSSNESRYKYVRRIKNKWQARVWDGRIKDHVNLGLYDEERAAWDAARRYFLRGEIPDGIYPKYVRTHGDLFTARLTVRRGSVTVGPFLWPEVAQRFLFGTLARKHRAKYAAVASRFPEAEISTVDTPDTVDTPRRKKVKPVHVFDLWEGQEGHVTVNGSKSES